MGNSSPITKALSFQSAEQQRMLTVASLSNVLSVKDQNYLTMAMRQYGDMRVQEARHPEAVLKIIHSVSEWPDLTDGERSVARDIESRVKAYMEAK